MVPIEKEKSIEVGNRPAWKAAGWTALGTQDQSTGGRPWSSMDCFPDEEIVGQRS
jgi:hypothetical protein